MEKRSRVRIARCCVEVHCNPERDVASWEILMSYTNHSDMLDIASVVMNVANESFRKHEWRQLKTYLF